MRGEPPPRPPDRKFMRTEVTLIRLNNLRGTHSVIAKSAKAH